MLALVWIAKPCEGESVPKQLRVSRLLFSRLRVTFKLQIDVTAAPAPAPVCNV